MMTLRAEIAADAVDGRRERGSRSRAAIMAIAVHTASTRGLEGLSIGSLATAAGVSKSGVVALFGAKEQLQLATIEAARLLFLKHVVEPTRAAPGGRARVDALVTNWIAYSRDRVFDGGCFFAAARVEFGSRSGAVHDAVARASAEWLDFVTRTVASAQLRGELTNDVPAAQLAFEVVALLDAANTHSLLGDSDAPYESAGAAIRRALRPPLVG